MTGLTLWAALIVAEVVLVLLGGLTFFWLRSLKLRRLDRKAIQALVAKVKQKKGEREAAIRKLLSERFKLSDDLLQASSTAMLREELALYQQFANLYAKRDAGAARNFDITFEAVLAPYWSLPEQQVDVAHVQAEPSGADADELERLTRENHDLREELQVTMDTMSRMLDEYTSMFHGGPSATDPVPGKLGGFATESKPEGDATVDQVAVAGSGESPEDFAQADESVSAAATEPMCDSARVSDEVVVGFESGAETEAGSRPAGLKVDEAPNDTSKTAEAETEQLEGSLADGNSSAPALSDADADALLADALGGADLAIDELDDLEDLFDEEDADDLDDGKVTAAPSDFDDEKAVSV